MTDAPRLPHPFADLIGMEVETVEPGRAVARVTVGPSHLNPHGVVHGAVMFALIDTSMGGAASSILAAGERPATIEAHVRFLRPVLGGILSCETTVVKPGRRIVHLESRVSDVDGTLVATGSGSFAVL